MSVGTRQKWLIHASFIILMTIIVRMKSPFTDQVSSLFTTITDKVQASLASPRPARLRGVRGDHLNSQFQQGSSPLCRPSAIHHLTGLRGIEEMAVRSLHRAQKGLYA